MTTLCFIDTETTGLDPERHEVWEVAIILRTVDEQSPAERYAADVRAWSAIPEGEREHATVPILAASSTVDVEYVWQLPVDLARADTIALNIGHFPERRDPRLAGMVAGPGGRVFATQGQHYDPSGERELVTSWTLSDWCRYFAELTWGAHMIGCVPSFDTDRFLERLLRAHGACPGWHYQPIDVETLAVGSILGSLSMMSGEESVAEAIARAGDEAGSAIREHSMKHPPDHAARFATSRRFFLERATLPWDSERLSSWFGINPEHYERHSALGDARWARDLWDAIWEGATQ